MITIGYIGNGKSANRYHLPFVLQKNNIKVKTIYQRNPKNEKWGRIAGVNYTSDLDELLQIISIMVFLHIWMREVKCTKKK